jgi:hypothetical protein
MEAPVFARRLTTVRGIIATARSISQTRPHTIPHEIPHEENGDMKKAQTLCAWCVLEAEGEVAGLPACPVHRREIEREMMTNGGRPVSATKVEREARATSLGRVVADEVEWQRRR